MNARTFPHVEASTVDGRTYEFPRDFAGSLTVAALAYRIEHRTAIESWVPTIEAIVTSHPGVRGLAFAILPAPMRLGRKAIEATMRKAMSEVQREVSVLVFTDVPKFAASLDIPRDAFALVLIDAAGSVRWRALGPYTAAAGEELRAAIDGA